MRGGSGSIGFKGLHNENSLSRDCGVLKIRRMYEN
jgi:hypothetical protein